MSADDELAKASSGLLAYDAPREYRPSGAFEPRAAMRALGWGVACAALSAALIIGWHATPVPVVIGVSGAVQGVALGMLMRWVFRRSKLRSLAAALLLCVACSLIASTLTYAGLYVRQVYLTNAQMRRMMAGAAQSTGGSRRRWTPRWRRRSTRTTASSCCPMAGGADSRGSSCRTR